jgi:hypothetical protein
MDIDFYRKTDRSLGHRVYRKQSLYLHQNSHHHPANEQPVLASLIHRATGICDQDSLIQELEFLTTVFKKQHSADTTSPEIGNTDRQEQR